MDFAVGEPGDGVATFFVPVVFAAKNACVVRVGESTTRIRATRSVSGRVWGEVIDLARSDTHVTAGPVALRCVELSGEPGVPGEQAPPAKIDRDPISADDVTSEVTEEGFGNSAS